jgi:membrane-bound serine protease (ClpP class)
MLVSILANPNVAYVLLTVGIIGVIVELHNPGGFVPGATGLIALVLAFIGFGNLPFNWTGLALILLAFVLFVLDIQVSGFALSIAGIAAYVTGSLLLFGPPARTVPEAPYVGLSLWLVALMTALVGGSAAFLLAAAVRAHEQVPLLGEQTPVGKLGVAVSDLAPEGIVRVESETWTAIATDGIIRAGEAIEVVAVQGLRLDVRRPSHSEG